MKTTIVLKDEAATVELGQKLAQELAAGSIILLSGDLGTGKTTLARAFLRERCDDGDMAVPSPTFTLYQPYETEAETIWHMDLYRLEDPEEVLAIGWDEVLGHDITALIEWPDRLGPYRPTECIDIELTTDGDGRMAVITGTEVSL